MKFEEFLKEFVPQAARKSKQLNQAYWILETTGSSDAADLKGELDIEFRLLFNSPEIYKKLLAWDREPHDPIAKRELNVLIRAFKQNQIPKNLLEEIAQREALLAQSYANFRPELDGKQLSENDIWEWMKKENNPVKRKKIWEASKQIGPLLAPQILALVRLRNQSAQVLGYSDYFQMQLDLQEVEPKWLLKTLEDLSLQSERAYSEVLAEIKRLQAERFGTKELGPWAWSDPFCQEDPLDSEELDQLTDGVDIAQTSAQFYREMGIDVEPILSRSDMYERPGKNQHAFCINLDREGDVRTLNNVKPSIKWLDTVLHELGHGIYELGFDQKLPWLLREPPHMITTEAMALIAGRQAHRSEALARLVGPQKESLRKKAEKSLRRCQLIFSRWVLVMSAFESELYRDPDQNLNRLWWQTIEKYQKIAPPTNRDAQPDWACKYHIGLAPVYYFSYLLGEMFASAIQETLVHETGSPNLSNLKAGQLLNKKLFGPGNRMPWNELVEHVTGAPLSPNAWVKEFAT
ncbi:MAG: M2 family metallopeptidase [Chlamydiales bacterium]